MMICWEVACYKKVLGKIIHRYYHSKEGSILL
jgi:hypothetical protein